VRLRLPLHDARDAARPGERPGGVITQIRLDPLGGPGEVEIVRLVLRRF
jgi:hypothetical protein